MFSYVEAELSNQIESAMMESYVCYTNKPMKAVEVKDLLESYGLNEIKVLGVNCFTFTLKKILMMFGHHIIWRS